MPIKRFLLFAGCNFYARGGWCDFRGSFETLPEAQDAWKAWVIDEGYIDVEDADGHYWFHVIDLETQTHVDHLSGFSGNVDCITERLNS